MTKKRTNVRKHPRRTPSGRRTNVRRHDRTYHFEGTETRKKSRKEKLRDKLRDEHDVPEAYIDAVIEMLKEQDFSEDEITLSEKEWGDDGWRIEVGSQEWYFFTDEGATRRAKESVESIFDDMGLESFSPHFQDWILDNAVDVKWFEGWWEESDRSYINDLHYDGEDEVQEEFKRWGVEDVDEYVEKRAEDRGNPAQAVRDDMGDEYFRQVVKEHNLVNIDTVADEVINVDGRGMQIAGYDHVEHEHENIYYYRHN